LNRLKKILFIGWVLTVLLSGRSNADDVLLQITSNDKFYYPNQYISFLKDPDNAFELPDVLELENEFIPLEKSNQAQDLHNSVFWIKFHVQNFNTNSPYLELENSRMETIEYYLVDNSGTLVHENIVDKNELTKERSFETSDLLLNMHLDKGAKFTCYLRIKPSSSLGKIPIRIASLENYYRNMHSQNLWQGIYFGLIAFLLIYNIFLFISIKDTSYLYFAIFIGFTGLLFSHYSNVGNQLIWNTLPPSMLWEPILAAAASSSMILFSSRFLNSSSKTPKLHLWLLALMIINIPFVIIGIFGFHQLSIKLILYNSAMSLLFLMFLTIMSWRSGYQPAKFYLMAWSFHVVGILISLLMVTSLISIEMNIAGILQTSSTLSIFFMSFALSKKINLYIERRKVAQELVLKTAMQNEKLISIQNQLLEEKVHQRTIDLEQSISTLSKQRKDLQDANVFKDKVFSIISHDLKSPISSLAGLLQIMKMKTLNEEERSKAISSLEIALKGTKNLLDNVLAWASKSTEKTEETEEIELQALIDEIFQIFHFQAEKKGIQLKNLIEHEFYILSNRDMLLLVIRNLVSNALKFTKKEGTVAVGMRQDFLNIEIFVKDNGVGMSSDFAANLFKSNRHNSTRGTENEKGTGLGLILCKEFAEKYNGTIHAVSELKKGSTFTLTLKNAIPVLETVTST